MKKRLFLVAGIALIAIILSFVLYQRAHAPIAMRTVTLTSPDGRTEEVTVEIADDDAERALGLMHRDALEEGTGMLFAYPAAQPLSFWMKNTLIPLDILFFDEEGRFVSRATMDPCVTETCAVYESEDSAMYGLEVNRGERRTLDAGAGWTMRVGN